MKTITYTFHPITHCNLCDSEQFKVLGKRMNLSQGIRPRKKVGISTTVMQCKTCGLIFSNPQPIPAQISDHYGTPPESYWNEQYFTWNEEYFKGEIQRFFELYPATNGIGLKALDIGAGIGKCMLSLAHHQFEVFGLEPSEPFYQRAIEKMGIKPEKLLLSSVEEAHYIPNTFDFITFGAVVEHLYDPGACIEQAMQWLKPKGLMHIEVPSAKWKTSNIINTLYRLQGLDYVCNISPMHTPYHLHEFTHKSFEAHAQRKGYEVAWHKYWVTDTFLPKVLNPILKPYMRMTNGGMQLEIWLRKP